MLKSNIDDLRTASEIVYRHMLPTPQYCWPDLCRLAGLEVWVKHENHTPTGAFKVRGGIIYLDWLRSRQPDLGVIVTATRGNHGISIARAAHALGLGCRIVVPLGNSPEKNSAMRSWGADLIETGADFDEARMRATRLALEEGFHLVPAFHREIVRGVATCGLELLTNVEQLDAVYVPMGCGSGACGMIAARDAIGLGTEIIGVVSSHAPAAKLSFERGQMMGTLSAHTFADGLAVRQPVEEAFAVYSKGLSRIVEVNDEELANSIRVLHRTTHNMAEGAGAAALAAMLRERDAMRHKKVAVVLSGANIDAVTYAGILRGETPLTAGASCTDDRSQFTA